jgi:ABC-type uncharacterized transport system permease subunit
VDGNYLIPANTKQGQLILGLFRPIDLMLLGCGASVTLILMFIIPLTSVLITILALSPGLICAALVLPIPYYHNILVVISEFFSFITSRQKFIWKGWCASNEEKK